MRKIIFVAGIHGVGKTFLCSRLSKKLDIPHFSASQMIAQQREKQFTESKNVEHIESNQDQLITAINNHTNDYPTFLLDGHFCLLNKDGEVIRLSKKTFEKLQPCCYVVLVDENKKISSRLEERDNIKYDIEFLENFQNAEISYAKELAVENSVPIIFHSTEKVEDELYDFIESCLKY